MTSAHTILTSAGRLHHLDGQHVWSSTNVSSVREIAHALSQINRFTGHCRRPYSVAEHSLLVADIALRKFELHDRPHILLAALMHDAHESNTGDAASPIKQVLGEAWTWFEDEQQASLLEGYGLRDTFEQYRDLVKICDLTALATERRDLMPWHQDTSGPWEVLDKKGEEVSPWPHANLYALWRRCAPWWFWRWRLARRIEQLMHQWEEME